MKRQHGRDVEDNEAVERLRRQCTYDLMCRRQMSEFIKRDAGTTDDIQGALLKMAASYPAQNEVYPIQEPVSEVSERQAYPFY